MKEVKLQNLWTFERRFQEKVDVPKWIIVSFLQRDRQDSHNLFNDNLYRLPVTSAQCIIATEKNPENALSINYGDDEHSQGFGKN